MNVLATVRLPHVGWKPRPHQKKLWRYLMRGGKRAVAVWHRRAGKDEICLHATSVAMFERPGNYWHCLPEFTMGRKAIWDAVNPHTGQRRIDEVFPHEMRAHTRETDMQIRYHNGSTFNVVGSDAVTAGSGIGSSTAGIVFSEYALANPSAWAYYRPILEENNGWATFISTPRGRNHLFSLYQHAGRTNGWFCERLTAEDTGALSSEALAEALKEYVALYGADQGEGQFRQEYLCDWSSALLGSFYQREMADVRNEGRIIEIEPLDGVPIHRAWDLGIGDDTSVWWFVAHGPQILILDHFATSGVGLEWWRDEIFKRERERGWVHGNDYVPHDAKVKELGTGRTRVETMASLGLKPMLVPWATLDDGINAVRRTLPLCVFHPRTEEGGISALEQYRREWDEDKKAFRASAVHNWTSHVADSFRYLAMSWRPTPRLVAKEPKPVGWRIPPPQEPRRGGIVL
jgi:hypothetical protein